MYAFMQATGLVNDHVEIAGKASLSQMGVESGGKKLFF
jgi:hypothetical protein